MANTIQDDLTLAFTRKILLALLSILTILVIGTASFYSIGKGQYPITDCLYMTFITISTIGFEEVIDMSGNPGARMFTILLAVFGIATLTYILSNFTAFVIEGELNEVFRRKKMEKMIGKVKDHYIVCGIDGVGYHIVNELFETGRPHIIVDMDREKIEKLLDNFHEKVFVQGDASDSEVLMRAGIERAQGLFAATGDDKQNIVISLTAKQLNPKVRVVARCGDMKNIEKVKTAGADAVISPTMIGGLRMASEMIRPTAVSFLDVMLRDKEKKLRIEGINISGPGVGKSIADLNIRAYPGTLIVAVKKSNDEWLYNPVEDYVLQTGDSLVIMSTPEERAKLEKLFSA